MDVSPSRVAVLQGPPGRWAVAVLTLGTPWSVDFPWCLWGEPCDPAEPLSLTSLLRVALSPISQFCCLHLVPEAASREKIAAEKLGLGEKNNPVETLIKKQTTFSAPDSSL